MHSLSERASTASPAPLTGGASPLGACQVGNTVWMGIRVAGEVQTVRCSGKLAWMMIIWLQRCRRLPGTQQGADPLDLLRYRRSDHCATLELPSPPNGHAHSVLRDQGERT